jgi:alkanesulfonate monooxygenase SsuD/methylene tetrahydromethanopterin reductase-like flavin-dependent oxidoreductase (luciferase family)
MDGLWNEAERAALAQRARYTVVGSPETLRKRIAEIIDETRGDEFIATSQIYDHPARLHSFELVNEIFKDLGGK